MYDADQEVFITCSSICERMNGESRMSIYLTGALGRYQFFCFTMIKCSLVGMFYEFIIKILPFSLDEFPLVGF